ncbi:MAG: hypothetical protein EOO46_15975 [Flavobacterium sp.]|nr:MAG: hypothetical protein EOO46_15975 [Flavobacterium sp.]
MLWTLAAISKMIRHLTILVLCFLLTSSFIGKDRELSEYSRLKNLEYQALRNKVGKVYLRDLTHKEGCNKTRVQYLGNAHTKNGKSYKILTSFFVFSASATCHGTSRIKIFDMKNRYIGEYNVGMPEALPDALNDFKLLYFRNSDDCNLRTTRSIDLHKGLPKIF